MSVDTTFSTDEDRQKLQHESDRVTQSGNGYHLNNPLFNQTGGVDKLGENIDYVLDHGVQLLLTQKSKGNELAQFTLMLSGILFTLDLFDYGKTITIDLPLLTNQGHGGEEFIPLTCSIHRKDTFREHIVNVKRVITEVYNGLPFYTDQLKKQESNCLISAENLHENPIGTDQYDFVLTILTTNEVGLGLRFSKVGSNAFAGLFKDVLQYVLLQLHNVDQSLAEIAMLVGTEVSPAAFRGSEIVVTKGFLDVFQSQVKKDPGRCAVVSDSVTLTYSELDERSDSMAVCLKEQYSVKVGDRVVVMSPNTHHVLISMVALMKVGAVYLPVDIETSEERTASIIEDAQPTCLLLNSDAFAKVGQFTTIPMFAVDFQMDALEPTDIKPKFEDSGESVAYMIYTSGTTGNPKGICVKHNSFMNMILSVIEMMHIPPATSILQSLSIGFDVSLMEMGMALISGSTLYMMPRNISRDIKLYVDYLLTHQIKVAGIQPSVMNLLDSAALNDMIIYTGGESPSIDILTKLNKNNNQLYNQYGLTETACVSLIYNVFESSKKCTEIYIGKPIANSQVVLLNDDEVQVSRGIVGHIWIGGLGVNPDNHAISSSGVYKHLDLAVGAGVYYKTGDLGLMMPEGQMLFLGRIDNQVKVRGNRVELSAVEAAILNLEEIVQSRVLYFEEPDQHLVAFCKASDGISSTMLREKLAATLPEYMVPTYWSLLEEIPLSVNGKIDDKALRTIEYRNTGIAKVEILSETEKVLIQIWRQMLSNELIYAEDDFFEVGGHSLKATQIVTRINEELGCTMELHEFFANPTVRSLAAVIETSDKVRVQHWEQLPDQKYYQASHAQKRLWLLHQIEEDQTAYNIYSTNKITGELDFQALGQAVDALIRRHEILRTNFNFQDGMLMQHILTKDKVKNRQVYQDLRNVTEATSIVENEIMKLAKIVFQLDRGHLFVCKLLRTKENEFYLLFCMHHIISDGWSIQVMIHDLMNLYDAFCKESTPRLPDLNVQYKEYAYWQNQQLSKGNFDKEREYWHKQLSGPLPVLELPTYKMRPRQMTSNGAVKSAKLSDSIAKRLIAFREKRAVSFFVLNTAITKVLFYHLTHQKDILLGTIISGRDNRNVQDQIGYYVNTVVVRSNIDPLDSFKEVLVKVKQTVHEAFENGHYPFDLLVDELVSSRDMSHSPFFDVIIETHNFEGLIEQGTHLETLNNDLTIEHIGTDNQTAICDLNIVFREEADGIFFDIRYNTDIFEGFQVQTMMDQFCLLAERIMDSPDTPVSKMSIISDEESRSNQVLEGPTVDISLDETVVSVFKTVAMKYSERIAVRFKGDQMSYRKLDEESDRIAAFLVDCGVKFEEVVAVMMQRNHLFISMVMGIWKAGACYLPIAPDTPVDRTDFMLSNANVKVLMADQSFTNLSAKESLFGSLRHLLLVGDDKTARNEDKESNGYGLKLSCKLWKLKDLLATDKKVAPVLHGNNLAYILYTSGSTGKPKAAMIEHQGMLNHLYAKVEELDVNIDSVIAQNASQSFDISIWQMFTVLLRGGVTVVIPNETILDEPSMIETLSKTGVTILQVVPSYLNILTAYISREQNRDQLKRLEILTVTGEAVHTNQINAWLSLFPKVPILNAYGPTEASDDVTHHWLREILPNNTISVPIGRPVRNVKLKIVSPEGEPCAIGVKGELLVYGIGVGRGYYADPERTKRAFAKGKLREESLYKTGDIVRLLPSGDIEFLGRADHQVKVRGHRIELGEIESNISQLSGIDGAVVAIDEYKNLQAFVISNDGLVDEDKCKQELRRYIPAYMMPSSIRQLAEFPLTANGKVDRKELLKMINYQEVEMADITLDNEGYDLTAIWMEVLGRPQIKHSDNFFELGGHSISATRLSTQIDKQLGLSMSLREIFKHPILSEQLELLNAKREGTTKQINKAPERSLYHVSNAQKRLWMQDQLEHNQVAYNMPAAYLMKGFLDIDRLEEAFDEVINRHESIRTVFIQKDEEVWQKIIETQDFEFRIQVSDLSKMPDPHKEVGIQIEEELQLSFDLNKGPLFRAKLLKLGDSEHVLLFSTHHIVSDGWSMGILVYDFIRSYNSLCIGLPGVLKDLPIQYKDYAWWQQQNLQENKFVEAESYWKTQFADKVPVLELPLDQPRGVKQSFLGDVCSFELSETQYRDLKTVGESHQVTLFSLLMSSVYILLYRLTGQTDMVIGFPTAGRNHHLLEEQIGFYINTLALRINESDQVSFQQLIQNTAQQILRAYEYEDYPFDMLVEALDLTKAEGRNTLFDVMVQIQNASQEERITEELMALDVESYPYKLHGGVSKFDLTFNITERNNQSVRIDIEYNTDLFLRASIERFSEELLKILDTCLTKPSSTITEVKEHLMKETDKEHLNLYKKFQEDEISTDF